MVLEEVKGYLKLLGLKALKAFVTRYLNVEETRIDSITW